ncbi:polyprenyl diphosphate synthase [Agarivorans gilvus]|uniref:Ditrans,polycis-undecaprenyl-diphosphate synthase ((2E,6E)-farnesyl-diphosphate specific) n=1 Tax=Agarivorans gilvus TaxID=680279 RepID=A0ABQ1I160_9ALTE|nr:polyprenyl diphosphate synthase [Agarivorans gilvus]GGB01626.1 ditrans,polycis-undecaprenyl-diphosphate synthase ((2E,6E)-farnesyl-diphosphate specific) [Agarivorans gilvus]
MTLPEAQQAAVKEAMPKHVAIIMDGNGRWAQQRGKLRMFGHQAGVKSVRRAVSFATQVGIQSLTLFAFSSENWRRPEEEVSSLMNLFLTVLQREVKKLKNNNVQLRIIGDTSRFSEKLQQRIAVAQQETADNTGLVLNIAANYGGRWDMLNACQQLCRQVKSGALDEQQITEQDISTLMEENTVGDVDLLIRTGGDHRISNFLLWQTAYAEFYFSDVLWPDFDDDAFGKAIAAFVSRERRFGCTGEQVQALLNNNQQNEDHFA